MTNKLSKASAFVVAAAMLTMSLTVSAAAQPTAPGHNKIKCFDGTTDGNGLGGICTLTSNGVKSPATLDNADSNPAGDYSGVYFQESTLFGQSLNNVEKLSYDYSGITTPIRGDLSLDLPINVYGGSSTQAFLYVDAASCPGNSGHVDVVNDPNCGIYYNNTTLYPNWAALVAAYPAVTIATDNYAFVIAQRTPSEAPASWTVSKLTLGKGGK